jgi:hypothetical protein
MTALRVLPRDRPAELTAASAAAFGRISSREMLLPGVCEQFPRKEQQDDPYEDQESDKVRMHKARSVASWFGVPYARRNPIRYTTEVVSRFRATPALSASLNWGKHRAAQEAELFRDVLLHGDAL